MWTGMVTLSKTRVHAATMVQVHIPDNPFGYSLFVPMSATKASSPSDTLGLFMITGETKEFGTLNCS